MTREESFAYYRKNSPEDLFDVKETTVKLPEKARIFRSVKCEECKEIAAENYMHLENGRWLCRDCCHTYDRFQI